MSKRPAKKPGVFTNALRRCHYSGSSPMGRCLAKRAEGARKRRVQWLRREHFDNSVARKLAKKLEACRPKLRCHSGACPVCAQAAQELFVRLVERHQRGIWGMQGQTAISNAVRKPFRVVAITIVPAGLSSDPGELDDLPISQVHRRATDRLAKAKVHVGVGVLEVGLVEHADGRYPLAWAWHLHGVALTRNPDALAKRLKMAFPRTDVVPRPVQVVPWDGSRKWLRYCHKLDGRCRVGFNDQLHFNVRKQQPRTCRTTERRSLTPDERLELLLFHDKISLDSRILTKGAQLRSTQKGCSIVKLRRPKRKSMSN